MRKTKLIIAIIAISAFLNKVNAQATNNFAPNNNFNINNFLGWNASNGPLPLNIRTNGLNRIVVNQLFNGTALAGAGSAVNNLGGFGLTRIGISLDGTNPINNPRSLLHMGEPLPGAGVRDWMDLGTLISRGSDFAFFGHRQKNTVDLTGRTSLPATNSIADANDAVIAFGDNGLGPVGAGSDNLTFIYNDQNTNANVNGPNFQNSNYGREMMRMTGNGNIGIGPVFLDNAQPQNMLHINNNLNIPVYMQISNQTGTGQSGTDGFHLGITGTGIAELNQRENLDMRFFTFGSQRAVIKNNGLVGINTNAPANRVEISAAGGDPYFATNNASGLMFTNLTSAKNVVPLGTGVTNTKLLSVDGAGNVIMVAAPNSVPTANQGLIVTGANVQLGGLCSGILPQITGGSRGINLNGNNFVWQNGRTGFNIAGCTPGNVVEITSTTPIGSGLRFTNLTNATPAGFGSLVQANGKVLAVNANGDVIIVPAPGGQVGNGLQINNGGLVPVIELGAQCTDGTGLFNSRFQNSRALSLNGFNFWMYSSSNGNGGVGVGGKPTPLTPNLCNIGNTFEISANNQGKYGNTNASGLRLSKLTASSPTLANGTNGINTNKVLTVDQDGDVVLVTSQGIPGPVGPAGPAGGINMAQNGLSLLNPTTVELGGLLGSAASAQLLNNREIPMAAQKIFFTGFSNDGLVIGPNSLIGLPLAKLHVISTDGASRQSVYVENNNVGSTNIGITSKAINSFGNSSFGVDGTGGDGRFNVGVIGRAAYTPWSYLINGPGWSYGVHGEAIIADDMAHTGVRGEAKNSTFQNLGGYFTAENPSQYNRGVYSYANAGTVFNRAIHGETSGTSSGGTVDNWAGYFDGDVNVTGGFFINNVAFSSDAMFKNQIDTIVNPANIIKLLKPRSYFFDTTNTFGMNFSNKKQYGFIAQDVQTVLPELVSTVHKAVKIDSVGNIVNPAVTYKALNYNAFFALITAAMQKQQSTIDSLKKKDSLQTAQIAQILTAITTLSNSVASCCSNAGIRTTGITGNNPNQLNIELSDADVIVLNQNLPNPFAEQTIITYNVPAKYGFAQMVFKTLDGKIIKTVDITTKGKGQMNVFASDLSNGLYMYSLIVDGKVIDTKKMVKQ